MYCGDLTARLRLALCLSLGALTTSCLESRTSACGTLLCPGGTVCAPGAGRCVTPARLAACTGLADETSCTLPEAAAAQCRGGVCTPIVCGDGLVMRGEACDDGNTTSCDGCSADCRSTEGCGNGLVECAEQCDDGAANSLAPNAGCRPDCRRQRCGDGVVDDRSGEDCDGADPAEASCQSLGYYGGSLGCSSACRADVSTCAGHCGDGVVNGLELCDGAPPPGQSCLDFGYDLGNLYCGTLCTPSFSTCQRLAFLPMNFTGTGIFINGTWASSASDVFAVGYAGAILHFDGGAWGPMDSQLDPTLIGVGGSGPSDVYAVGREGSLAHYDGLRWAAMDSGVSSQLNAAWASGPRDVFAGGRPDQRPDGTYFNVMLHSDGTGVWSLQDVPIRDGGDVFRIYSVWGSGPADVFATASGEILHYDGSAWSFMELPQAVADAQLDLYAIWGSGPKDVFVVGDLGTVLHFDGQTWSAQASGTGSFLNAVDGTGPLDVYAAGDQGVVVHYNGHAWAPIPSGTTQALNGVSAKGDQVIIAGPGTLQRFFRGTPILSQVSTGMTGSVTSLWSSGPSNVIAVSTQGEIARFDGQAWSAAGPEVDARLWSVWGSGPADLFAVGNGGSIYHSAGPPTDGGLEWHAMSSPVTDVSLNWVWGSGPTDVYASGESGALLHYDGSTWSKVPTGVDAYLYAVWGTSAQDVFVVGGSGTVLHYDGAGWASLDTGTTAEFWGVWGTGAGEVYLFADQAGVYRYDGTRFLPATVNSIHSFNYGMGSGPTDVLAVEYQGQGLFHFDGVDWTALKLPAVTSFSLFSTRTVSYVGAAGGLVVELDRNCASRENRCDDRWDDDCDGLLNCADPDCVGDAYCSGGGLCQTLSSLACGTETSGDTSGGSPHLEQYGCAPRAETGRERAYRFTASATGPVTIELNSASAELDALLLGTFPSGGCDPLGTCLAITPHASGPRRLTFAATAGAHYFVVVDAAAGAAGPFSLQVTCP